MKKLVIFFIIFIFCIIQTTAFAFSISDNSDNGVRIGILEDVKINKEAPGSVLAIMGNAEIHNDVKGDVIVVFGNTTIDAKVSGSVVAVLGTVTLTEKANIEGDLISVGEVKRNDSVTINGYFKSVNLENFNLDTSKLSIFIILKSLMLIIFILFVIIFGFPLLAIFNKRFKNISEDIDLRLGKKFSIGLPGFVICFMTLILLGITGLIPLLYFFFAILIEIVVSIFIGKIIMKLFNTQWNIYIIFIFGLLFLVLLKAAFIFLIYVNGFPAGVAMSFGFDLLVNALGTGILIESQFGKKVFN
jgi:hypothetical protein